MARYACGLLLETMSFAGDASSRAAPSSTTRLTRPHSCICDAGYISPSSGISRARFSPTSSGAVARHRRQRSSPPTSGCPNGRFTRDDQVTPHRSLPPAAQTFDGGDRGLARIPEYVDRLEVLAHPARSLLERHLGQVAEVGSRTEDIASRPGTIASISASRSAAVNASSNSWIVRRSRRVVLGLVVGARRGRLCRSPRPSSPIYCQGMTYNGGHGSRRNNYFVPFDRYRGDGPVHATMPLKSTGQADNAVIGPTPPQSTSARPRLA